MHGFAKWLEGDEVPFRSDEPSLSHRWAAWGNGRKLTIWLRLPGYVNNPMKRVDFSDEIGSLELETLPEQPDHMYVSGVGVNKEFQRQGLGSEMYRYALTLVKSAGYRGITSYRNKPNGEPSRTHLADKLWNHLRTHRDDQWDYLEYIKNPSR